MILRVLKTRDEFARIFATFLSAKRAALLSNVMVFEKLRKENSRLFKYIIDRLTFEIAKQESKLESFRNAWIQQVSRFFSDREGFKRGYNA